MRFRTCTPPAHAASWLLSVQLLVAGAASAATLYVDNTAGAGGDCSESAPCAELARAEASSQPGDIIVIRPGDGTTRGYDGGIRLKPGQRLTGARADGRPHATISSAFGPGVLLADGVEVRGVRVSGSAGSGVEGDAITGATIEDVEVEGGGHGLRFTDCSGDITLKRLKITDSGAAALSIVNASGTVAADLEQIMIDTTTEGDGIFVHAGGEARIEVAIHDTMVANANGTGVHALADGEARLDFVLRSSAVFGGNISLDLDTGESGSLTFAVDTNSFDGAANTIINLFLGQLSTADAELTGSVTGNRLSKNDGSGFGIRVSGNGGGTLSATVENNTIEKGVAFDHGIFAEARLGDGRTNLELRGNSVRVGEQALDGIRIAVRDGASMCAVIEGNDAAGGMYGHGLAIESAKATRLALFGIEAPSPDAARIERALKRLNPKTRRCSARIEGEAAPPPAGGCGIAAQP